MNAAYTFGAVCSPKSDISTCTSMSQIFATAAMDEAPVPVETAPPGQSAGSSRQHELSPWLEGPKIAIEVPELKEVMLTSKSETRTLGRDGIVVASRSLRRYQPKKLDEKEHLKRIFKTTSYHLPAPGWNKNAPQLVSPFKHQRRQWDRVSQPEQLTPRDHIRMDKEAKMKNPVRGSLEHVPQLSLDMSSESTGPRLRDKAPYTMRERRKMNEEAAVEKRYDKDRALTPRNIATPTLTTNGLQHVEPVGTLFCPQEATKVDETLENLKQMYHTAYSRGKEPFVVAAPPPVMEEPAEIVRHERQEKMRAQERQEQVKLDMHIRPLQGEPRRESKIAGGFKIPLAANYAQQKSRSFAMETVAEEERDRQKAFERSGVAADLHRSVQKIRIKSAVTNTGPKRIHRIHKSSSRIAGMEVPQFFRYHIDIGNRVPVSTCSAPPLATVGRFHLPDRVNLFVYGLDIDVRRVEHYLGHRCEDTKLAILFGYSIGFNKVGLSEKAGSFLNVEKGQAWDSVEGRLFNLTKYDIETIDNYNGCPRHFHREYVTVWTSSAHDVSMLNKPVEAMVYIAQPEWIRYGVSPLPTFVKDWMTGTYGLSPLFIRHVLKLSGCMKEVGYEDDDDLVTEDEDFESYLGYEESSEPDTHTALASASILSEDEMPPTSAVGSSRGNSRRSRRSGRGNKGTAPTGKPDSPIYIPTAVSSREGTAKSRVRFKSQGGKKTPGSPQNTATQGELEWPPLRDPKGGYRRATPTE